jgi:hypothetical protein
MSLDDLVESLDDIQLVAFIRCLRDSNLALSAGWNEHYRRRKELSLRQSQMVGD